MRALPVNLLILACALCLFAGCDRDFGSPPRPDVEVVDPDLSLVQATGEIGLSLRVDSPRDVDRVTVDGTELSFDTPTSTWMGMVVLEPGYNRLDVRSHIEDERPFADTLHAFRSHVTVEEANRFTMPYDAGGHTVDMTANGDLLLIGGAPTAAGSGFKDVSTRSPGDVRFLPHVWRLLAGRVGHTTTLLPDGRLLVLGGAFVGGITEIDQMIFEVEIVDPANKRITLLPFEGAPILRMYHTAVLRPVPGRVIVDLLGGRGAVDAGSDPRIDIRQDLRSFELVNDTLYALHPTPGPFVAPLAGHSQTPLGDASSALGSIWLVAGMTFGQTLEPATLSMDYEAPLGIDIADLAAPEPGTIRHAAARIGDGVVALLGGRGEDPSDVRNSISIFAAEAGVWFAVDNASLVNFPARYGHTATAIDPGRILVLGGFDADGNAMNEARIVSFGSVEN